MRKVFYALLLTIVGCGPEQTTKEKYDQQVQENVDQQKAILAPLAGKYIGTETYDEDGTTAQVMLYLSPITIIVTNPGTNQGTEVPTLAGSFNICTQADKCFQGDDTYMQIGQFTSARYNQSTRRLLLYGNAGTTQITMDANFEGASLKGRFNTAIKPVGTVVMKKVQ